MSRSRRQLPGSGWSCPGPVDTGAPRGGRRQRADAPRVEYRKPLPSRNSTAHPKPGECDDQHPLPLPSDCQRAPLIELQPSRAHEPPRIASWCLASQHPLGEHASKKLWGGVQTTTLRRNPIALLEMPTRCSGLLLHDNGLLDGCTRDAVAGRSDGHDPLALRQLDLAGDFAGLCQAGSTLLPSRRRCRDRVGRIRSG